MDITDCPYEIQERILKRLDSKDYVSINKVSKSWRLMICEFLDEQHSIKASDWKWYCGHDPKIVKCSQCLEKCRKRAAVRGLADDWKWWN